jgi:DNA helicase II / ATP-dependent DNA helicase PcrA
MNSVRVTVRRGPLVVRRGGLEPRPARGGHPRDGPLLVIAGAGRARRGCSPTASPTSSPDRGVSPFEILAITFTNKAADEMKHRVGGWSGPVADKMWVSTFHSACVRILRRDAHRLGFPSSFTIYDQADAQRLVGYVMRDLNLDAKRFPPRSVHATISAAKNDDLVDPRPTPSARGDLRAQDRRHLPRVPGPPAQGRRHGLRRPAASTGRAVPPSIPRCSSTTSAVPPHPGRRVPGHQPGAERAGLSLAGEHRNVCVVGDSDQSIYRFRGADIRNILEFEDGLPRRHGHRARAELPSTQTILDAANAVIANNLARKPKELWTDLGRRRCHHPLPRRGRGRRGPVGGPRDRPLHDGGHRWGDVASSTAPTRRAG